MFEGHRQIALNVERNKRVLKSGAEATGARGGALLRFAKPSTVTFRDASGEPQAEEKRSYYKCNGKLDRSRRTLDGDMAHSKLQDQASRLHQRPSQQ